MACAVPSASRWILERGPSPPPPPMPWLLPSNSSHHFLGLDQPVRIVQGLGSGSQGQVFKVQVGGESLALK